MTKKALLIIDHGSRKKGANHMLFDIVKLARSQRPHIIIYGAHMELAEPNIQQGVEWCINHGATHIIAHPYMLSPGRHAIEDIPRMVKESLSKHPEISYTVTPPLGVDLEMISLIMKRSGL
tara:strand:- start:255 stop:617 length:363 start_codon:yes stop_codon:yes gene_type:complete